MLSYWKLTEVTQFVTFEGDKYTIMYRCIKKSIAVSLTFIQRTNFLYRFRDLKINKVDCLHIWCWSLLIVNVTPVGRPLIMAISAILMIVQDCAKCKVYLFDYCCFLHKPLI